MSDKEIRNRLKFSDDDIKKCVMLYLNKDVDELIQVINYDIKNASDGLAGFQGEHYKMTVNVNVNGAIREIYFFIKSLPHDEEKARKLNEAGYFRRETTVYKNIFAQFKEKPDNYAFNPKYFISTQYDIILEDLSKKGFTITDQRKTLDYDHSIVALTALARFHASSIILESNVGYKIENKYHDVLDECGYKFFGWYMAGFDAVLEIVPETNIKITNETEFKTKCKKMYQDVLDLCCPSQTSKNVLSHRDLWSNNLMFRYDAQNKPEQCVLVDYQACRCMPVAGDVMSLIYLNSATNDREINLEKYLKHYHSVLSCEMIENNIEIGSELSWNQFRSECNVYKKWAIGQSTILLQMALLEKDVVVKLLENPTDYERIINVTRKDIVLKTIREDTTYRERLLPLVEEFMINYVL